MDPFREAIVRAMNNPGLHAPSHDALESIQPGWLSLSTVTVLLNPSMLLDSVRKGAV